MELNLLFLPLLGGYIFYNKFNLTAYFAARCSGQRLVFHAAAFGLILLVAARILALLSNSIRDNDRDITVVAAPAVIGCAMVVIASLFWLYRRSQRDRVLDNEGDPRKKFLGALIAIVSAGILFWLAPAIWADSILAIFSTLAAGFMVTALAVLVSFALHRWTQLYGFPIGIPALFLRSAILLLIASLCVLLWGSSVDHIDPMWAEFSPYIGSGTPFLACMIGALAWWPLNLMVPHQVASARLHRNYKTSALERFLYQATIEAALVQVTLKDGKVYVGWIDRLPADSSSNEAYLQILPSMSGYRDALNKKIDFTTYYDQFYEREDVDPFDFMKVIPIANIDSTGRFREDIYLAFRKEEVGVENTESTSSTQNPAAKI